MCPFHSIHLRSHLTRFTASSRDWVCPKCSCPNLDLLPDPSSDGGSSADSSTTEVSVASSAVPSTPATPAVISDVKEKGPADELPPARADASSPQLPIIAPRPQRPSPPPAILNAPLSIPPTPRTVSPRAGASTAQQVDGPKRDAPATQSLSRPRPPVLLDTAICVLLVLLFALIAKKVL